jgi:hypothetical protein
VYSECAQSAERKFGPTRRKEVARAAFSRLGLISSRERMRARPI